MINKIIPTYQIKERRTQPTIRKHYTMVEDCYKCDGLEYSAKKCPNSAYNPKKNLCEWRSVVNNDLEKIASGSGKLTFPILKKIVAREKSEHGE